MVEMEILAITTRKRKLYCISPSITSCRYYNERQRISLQVCTCIDELFPRTETGLTPHHQQQHSSACFLLLRWYGVGRYLGKNILEEVVQWYLLIYSRERFCFFFWNLQFVLSLDTFPKRCVEPLVQNI